ncbi:MAG: DNA primase [Planctomycetota bacterium]|nr:DNA primase [Planctomycetota bacterium]
MLDATDIVRLVGEHVSLKAKGREYVGLCPFHDDRNPSMYVVPHKQIFHCFVCGAGGNALDFMIRFHKMDFIDALRTLAERGGVELTPTRREAGDAASAGTGVERSDLSRANQFAQAFFRGILRHQAHGAAARQLIERRGISAEMADRFELGAAPDRWDGLLETARRKGVSERTLAAAGLIKPRTGGDGHYDVFRNRLIFPIHDQIGRPIAFGGRRINDEDDPKYLNSPETRLFEKSATLFGLRQAFRAIQNERRAIVTEGYTDVIACHQAGFENVVATLGTALTARHASMLKRLCDDVVLLFDADDAGQKAADRAIEVLFAEPIDVRIAVLPEGKDPDELFKTEGGAERFRETVDGAVDALEYRFRRMAERLTNAGSAGRVRAIEEDMGRLVELGLNNLPPIRRQLIVRRLAELAGVDERTIIEAMPQRKGGFARAGSASDGEPSPGRRSFTPSEHALGCLLCDPSLRLTIEGDERDAWSPAAYPPGPAQVVAEAFARLEQESSVEDEGPEPTLEAVLVALDDAEARRCATELATEIERITDRDDRRLRETWAQCVRRAYRELRFRKDGGTNNSEGESAIRAGDDGWIERIQQQRKEHETFGGNPLAAPRTTARPATA